MRDEISARSAEDAIFALATRSSALLDEASPAGAPRTLRSALRHLVGAGAADAAGSSSSSSTAATAAATVDVKSLIADEAAARAASDAGLAKAGEQAAVGAREAAAGSRQAIAALAAMRDELASARETMAGLAREVSRIEALVVATRAERAAAGESRAERAAVGGDSPVSKPVPDPAAPDAASSDQDAERLLRALQPPAAPPRMRVIAPDADLAWMAPELRPLRNWTVALHQHGSDYVSDEADRTGTFEAHVMARISSALGGPARPGNARKVFLDVGANVGFHSLFVLALGHEVEAFEPFGRNVALIRASVAANEGFGGRMRLHKRALTDTTDGGGALCILSTEETFNQGNARIVVLREPPTQAEQASGACTGRWARDGGDERWVEHGGQAPLQVGERVEPARLDALVTPGRSAHVIKADVEGYEALALRGAAGIFGAEPPCVVVFEYNNCAIIRASGVDCNAMVRDLAALGYRLFELGSEEDITPPLLGPNDLPTVSRRGADGSPVLSERKWAEYEMRLMAPEARVRCVGAHDVPREWATGRALGRGGRLSPSQTLMNLTG